MAAQPSEHVLRLAAGSLLARWRSARGLQQQARALAQQTAAGGAGGAHGESGGAQAERADAQGLEAVAGAPSDQQQQQQQQPPRRAWIERALPAGALPYAHLMRLEKPIGTYLLAWPGLWSIALAAPPGHLPDPYLSSLFIAGAVLLRGAGCTVNDLWDRDIDKQVERTRGRPLASGAVSVPQAVAFLGAQLLLGLGILLQLNPYTQLLGVASLGLVATYPLMKRVTGWPQAFLGLTINWGALMGYAAVTGSCDWGVVIPLYAAGVNWSLGYDTIYAHQDKKDDLKVGIGSTALTFGDVTKRWLAGFAAAQAGCLLLAGHAAGAGGVYAAAVAAGAAHQAWQIAAVDLDRRADCMSKFVANKWYGGILYAGIVADKLLAAA